MKWIALLALFTVGCSRGWERTDDALLRECWGASPSPNGTYSLHFEAIVFVATEGGIFAPSKTCRNYSMRVGRVDPAPERQLEPIQNGAMSREWTVIRGVAVVRPLDRAHEHLLRVQVVQFTSLEIMSDQDARQFVRFFQIG